MNREEQEKLEYHLQEAAKILFENTPSEKVQDFDSIEMTVRKHFLDTVAPDIASFFCRIDRDEGWKNQTGKQLYWRGHNNNQTNQKTQVRENNAHEL